jgi:hypothetical protein
MIVDALSLVGLFLGVAGPLIAVVLWLRRLLRRTVGRRRDHYARLERLGTNAQLAYFTSALGEPPAFRRTVVSKVHVLSEEVKFAASEEAREPEVIEKEKTFQECIYLDRDYFVQTVVDEDESVVAYSVTTRSRRFKPKLRSPGFHYVERGWLMRKLRREQRRVPLFDVRLGATVFGALEEPQKLSGSLGARTFNYWEAHWLGNPGHYQWYVFSINDFGAALSDPPIQTLFPPSQRGAGVCPGSRAG